MTPELGTPIDEASILDPTDDSFDELYIAYLELMSIQATTATLKETNADDEHSNAEIPSPIVTPDKSYPISPEVLRAILV